MKKAKHYIYGLDGLRALSVIAVIFYHLSSSFSKGGYLGVTLFFRAIGLFNYRLTFSRVCRY